MSGTETSVNWMTKAEKEVRHFSDWGFADHVITERSRQGVFRSWKCAKPNSWTYGFYITTIPGTIIVTGDIGDLIVQRVYDMLPFSRRSCGDTGYFASKVPHAIPTKEFSRDLAKEWIIEQLKDEEDLLTPENRTLLKSVFKTGMIDDCGPERLYEELYPIWQGNDPPSWNDYTNNFLWCRDAIRWFVTHHDEPEIECPA